MTSSKALEKVYVFEYVKFALGDGLLTAPGKIGDKLLICRWSWLINKNNEQHQMGTNPEFMKKIGNTSNSPVCLLRNLKQKTNTCTYLLHKIV